MTVRRFLGLLLLSIVAFAVGVALAQLVVLPRLIHRQREVIVPDLTGKQLEDARHDAERVGLELEVQDEVSKAGTPAGVVLDQQPRPLRSIRAKRPIRVIVSTGEALVAAPDLTGMTLRQVEISLLHEGLTLGTVARTFDPQGRLGVVAQRPRPGTRVAKGSPVDLLVREGLERVYFMAPSFVGRSLQTVQQDLERAGFHVRRATFRRDRSALGGTILEQSPAAGSRVQLGESFELVAASSG